MKQILIPVFFTPMRTNFAQGQAYLLLTALLAEGYLAHEKGRSWLAAFCWGFCILFKIFPAIVLFYLFFEKSYRTIWRTMAIMIAGSALMIPLLGWDVWFNYHRYILPRVANGELNHTFAFYYQSMQVALMILKFRRIDVGVIETGGQRPIVQVNRHGLSRVLDGGAAHRRRADVA